MSEGMYVRGLVCVCVCVCVIVAGNFYLVYAQHKSNTTELLTVDMG